ncbi:hypothetical protein J7E95_01300 [Streptomyces sp. ISL-14]|uniref:glutathionylspermidine synthase n=1 Tax=Bacillus sp. ISL-4 TaxID=2819125 RepID=UPI001C1C8345|nr:glutathionylspermidine synthase [Bacillus sp. ISL-4]MBT2669426.1 hypothetical protein [Streptomyces sp. ISL-14]
MNEIPHEQPLMTTIQYKAIYPYVAHMLYQELTFSPAHSTLTHYKDETENGLELDGFCIGEHYNGKAHLFVFTYQGTWFYNQQPLKIPNDIQEQINQLVCNSRECLIYNKSLTKENLFMDNIERLQMEIAGLNIPQEELLVYLEEEGLKGLEVYNSASKASKRAIYATALSILHSVANQPHLMKNYKQDDMTVSDFAKALQSRINQLEVKVRQMPKDDSKPSNFFNLFL